MNTHLKASNKVITVKQIPGGWEATDPQGHHGEATAEEGVGKAVHRCKVQQITRVYGAPWETIGTSSGPEATGSLT